MRIAVNARFLHQPYSGIGQYLRGLLDAHVRAHTGDVWVLFVQEPLENTWGDAVEIKVIPEKKWLPTGGAKKSYWEAVQFPKALQEAKAQLVFIPYPSLTSQQQLPQITCVHDVIPWVDKTYRRNLLSSAYHHATKRYARTIKQQLITVSLFSQSEIAEVLEKDPATIPVVHNGCPFETLSLPTTDGMTKVQRTHGLFRPYVVYVGGYDARKGVEELMSSYATHVAPNEPVDLVLIGHPLFSNGLYTMPAEDTSMEGHIRFIGHVSNEDLYALMMGSLGLAHFTNYEGFNLPILQAIYAHVPVLAKPLAVHEELFKGGYIAIKGDHKKSWERFLWSEKKRSFALSTGEKLKERYSFDRSYASFLQVCVDLLK